VTPTFAATLDKAIQSHPRDRFSSAREMLEALHSGAIRLLHSPTIISASPSGGSSHQTTVLSSPPVQTSAASAGMRDWQKVAIMGSLIGGFVLTGILLSRPQNSTSSSQPSATTSQQPASPSATPSQSPQPSSPPPTPYSSQGQQPSVPPVTTRSNSKQTANSSVSPVTTEKPQSSFYFVADSAFSNSDSAADKISVLKAAGYSEAGMFWIPDYPNLSGKLLFEVYVAKFGDRQSCANFLRSYRQRNSDAYCAFASKDRNEPADRFSAGG
jgi:serine/threonine-protein kinase